MGSNIRNLIIDFGGVLVGLDRDRCIRRFEALGVKDVDRLIDFYLQNDLFGKHEKGLISDDEFRAGLKSISSGKCPGDDEIDAAWNAFLTGVPRHKLDVLKAKRAEGFKVFMLSNTNHIHWTYSLRHFFNEAGYGINDCFDRVFLSFEMKLVKPDPAIFKAVLEATGARAEETLFVDDSEANCNAAAGLGIGTIHATGENDWTTMI